MKATRTRRSAGSAGSAGSTGTARTMSPDLAHLQPSTHDARSGTQSIERALRILRELAARGEFGWRLSDLAARVEVDKGTVHRVLSCLVRERFVQQRALDKHYFPGPMLYELGLSLPGQTAFQQACEKRLARLALATEAIAWMILRSGNEYVCSVRQGTLELRGLMVHAGTRRPLFTSVGGVAIMQTLPEDETEAILVDNVQQEIAKSGEGRLPALRKMRERSMRHGFGVNLGDVVPGVHAFAVPVRGADGKGFAAVCLTGLAEQFGESRILEIEKELREVAGDVEGAAKGLLPG